MCDRTLFSGNTRQASQLFRGVTPSRVCCVLRAYTYIARQQDTHTAGQLWFDDPVYIRCPVYSCYHHSVAAVEDPESDTSKTSYIHVPKFVSNSCMYFRSKSPESGLHAVTVLYCSPTILQFGFILISIKIFRESMKNLRFQ